MQLPVGELQQPGTGLRRVVRPAPTPITKPWLLTTLPTVSRMVRVMCWVVSLAVK